MRSDEAFQITVNWNTCQNTTLDREQTAHRIGWAFCYAAGRYGRKCFLGGSQFWRLLAAIVLQGIGL